MGGCISLIVSLLTFVFIAVQLYAFCFSPSYNQTLSTGYLSNKSDEVYNKPLTSFLPTFAVGAQFTDDDGNVE